MSKSPIFLNYVAAGYPLLWIQTHEEFRTMTAFAREMKKAKDSYKLYSWDVIDGIKKREIEDNEFKSAKLDEEGLNDVMVALQWAASDKGMEDNSILFLLDYHHYVKKDIIIRKIRNIIPTFKATGKVLVILSHTVDIPPELEKETTVVIFGLPDTDELRITLKSVCESAEAPYPKEDEDLLDAARGMTSLEAENAFSLSLREKKSFDSELIRREKAAIVKKTKLLEVIETKESINDIGGLNNLKTWLQTRQNCFTKEAQDFGIKPPKGLLLVGVPGTGKSLSAKVVASIFHRTLLRLDVGKVYGQYVGESESNIRKCLDIADAVAPTILWIDELEKSFSGVKGNGDGGHETSKRVFSTFLTWLAEKTTDVFIVATANNVHALPPELLRSGRFEVIFWVDVPDTDAQRKEILDIHLKKVGHEKDILDRNLLSKKCNGFTGAEIEVWVRNALIQAFQQGHNLTEQDFINVFKEVTPISVLMKDDIDESRKWAQCHGVKYASVKEEEIEKSFVTKKRKISLDN